MGQKINPILFRMGMSQKWKSGWFSDKDYVKYLQQDIKIRKYLKSKIKDGGIARVEIKRSADDITIIIHSSRPGIIIGRGGAGVEDLRKEIKKRFIKDQKAIKITIEEVKNPMLSAEIVLQSIIEQTVKRIPYRRIMKKSIERMMDSGAHGVRVQMSGRLNGVEIARQETLGKGRLPLHTLRANIDYARGTANTTYGTIGVKVWIYKEQDDKKSNSQEINPSASPVRPRAHGREVGARKTKD